MSALTAEASTDPRNENLRSGIDRQYAGKDNGVWVDPGEETMVFEWGAPRRVSGARIVFDSHMTERGKRMRKLEATTERARMPEMLAKSFRVDVMQGGTWRTAFSDDCNIMRLRKVSFDPVDAEAVRLVVDGTWGGDSAKAHVFAFDAL